MTNQIKKNLPEDGYQYKMTVQDLSSGEIIWKEADVSINAGAFGEKNNLYFSKFTETDNFDWLQDLIEDLTKLKAWLDDVTDPEWSENV